MTEQEYTPAAIRARIELLEGMRERWKGNENYQKTLAMDLAGLRVLLAQAIERIGPDKSVL